MEFIVIPREQKFPEQGKNKVYLRIDRWNDYQYVTMFQMVIYDKEGHVHALGDIKIGFKGQTEDIATYTKLGNVFTSLDAEYFSVGDSVEYYKVLSKLEPSYRNEILSSLNDIVLNPEIISLITDEPVFSVSLLRSQSLSIVKGQYARVLFGGAELTDYNFRFHRGEGNNYGKIDLMFKVEVDSKPSTNIHAIIGRNGVGKTTILNGMIDAVVKKNAAGAFYNEDGWESSLINESYFSSLVSVSFSAFDPFIPPYEQPEPSRGTCYFYIGLKSLIDENKLLTLDDLHVSCVSALSQCFNDDKKNKRWKSALEKLSSDENFHAMNLDKLEESYHNVKRNQKKQYDAKEFQSQYLNAIKPVLTGMSSGHAIVFFTITKLVATVEEKTLVLIDEPESHLHPPLLSAFIRALSDLLLDKNGVSIIATHSPVVLQEIPKSCVWKIYRRGIDVQHDRPSIETFGENVGILTNEIFSLEVEKSGFHDLLVKSIESGKTYQEIIKEYKGQIGSEGRMLLRTMLVSLIDEKDNHDEVD